MTQTLNEKERQFDQVLHFLSEALDIPPGKYQEAVDRYTRIGTWLDDGQYRGLCNVSSIYVQGSFRLGTVVRPMKEGKESDYDIDLVSELSLQKEKSWPEQVKSLIGDRLTENGTYRDMMKPEGKRCWTVEYAEKDGIGFHLDILPSVREDSCTIHDIATSGVVPGLAKTAIAITDLDKDTHSYSWSTSNPNGYATWFDQIKQPVFDLLEAEQRRIIHERHGDIFANVDAVPNTLIKTPLQHIIQILKRHRDVYFADRPEVKPISVIITTLTALAYKNETDIYTALTGILDRITRHAETNIIRKKDREWQILNPANLNENFADRWHEDNDKRARAFFAWINKIKSDIGGLLETRGLDAIGSSLKTLFGERVSDSSLQMLGDKYKTQRDSGSLRMASTTGMLSTLGQVEVKGHTFYGG
jgi:Cyclic GMP-AMP synthase DncV-like, nucleotidyltransferase domain